MSHATYLITGANRGIGLGLTTALLARPDTIVVAAVRDTTSASKTLSSLPTASSSKLIIVRIDSVDPSTAASAISELTSSHNISKLDVVIANAGISKYYGHAATTPLSEFQEHYQINVLGPVALFQATWPLLQKSEKPKFVAVSTGGASIVDMGDIPMPIAAYGSSKAGLNYVVRKIHFENEGLIAFPISPGWVQTDMGNMGAKAMGMEQAPVTLEESVNGILNKIDHATKEKTSGTFQSFDESTFNW